MNLSRDQIENRLVLAGQQVKRARQIVARQQRILDSLRKSGRPTAEAEILLDRLERSVGIFQGAESQLRRMLAAQGKSDPTDRDNGQGGDVAEGRPYLGGGIGAG